MREGLMAKAIATAEVKAQALTLVDELRGTLVRLDRALQDPSLSPEELRTDDPARRRGTP